MALIKSSSAFLRTGVSNHIGKGIEVSLATDVSNRRSQVSYRHYRYLMATRTEIHQHHHAGWLAVS